MSLIPDGHFNNVTGLNGRNRFGDFAGAQKNRGPGIGQQNDKTDSPSCQVLLVAYALVRRDKNVVSLLFCQIEQCAIVLA